MGSVTCSEMRELEDEAFRRGVRAEDLMEKAGRRIAEALMRRFPEAGTAAGFVGKGNNGGDALVALRYFEKAGWRVGIRGAFPENELGELPRKMLRKLGPVPFWEEVPRRPAETLLLLDGLLGIGGRGMIRPPLDSLAAEMNRLRETRGALTVALDLPSGVDGDTGVACTDAVRADFTLMVGLPKRGLLASAATNHVGALELIPLEELPVSKGKEDRRLICPKELEGCLPPRAFDFHKGQAGRLAIIAGSAGMEGAAALVAKGAVVGGAGLVMLFFAGGSRSLLARGLPPEVMVRNTREAASILDMKPDAVAIGPGLGTEAAAETLEWLGEAEVPAVLDADALNAIAATGRFDLLRENTIITPHPGEMRRLFPESDGLEREEIALRFVERYPGVLLYKGARTLVARRGEGLWCNATGTPGMAAGGQGDFLTGVIGALLAQKVPAWDAARVGAWLCGRASELAISLGGETQETLTATATAAHLAAAFRDWRSA